MSLESSIRALVDREREEARHLSAAQLTSRSRRCVACSHERWRHNREGCAWCACALPFASAEDAAARAGRPS